MIAELQTVTSLRYPHLGSHFSRDCGEITIFISACFKDLDNFTSTDSNVNPRNAHNDWYKSLYIIFLDRRVTNYAAGRTREEWLDAILNENMLDQW